MPISATPFDPAVSARSTCRGSRRRAPRHDRVQALRGKLGDVVRGGVPEQPVGVVAGATKQGDLAVSAQRQPVVALLAEQSAEGAFRALERIVAGSPGDTVVALPVDDRVVARDHLRANRPRRRRPAGPSPRRRARRRLPVPPSIALAVLAAVEDVEGAAARAQDVVVRVPVGEQEIRRVGPLGHLGLGRFAGIDDVAGRARRSRLDAARAHIALWWLRRPARFEWVEVGTGRDRSEIGHPRDAAERLLPRGRVAGRAGGSLEGEPRRVAGGKARAPIGRRLRDRKAVGGAQERLLVGGQPGRLRREPAGRRAGLQSEQAAGVAVAGQVADARLRARWADPERAGHRRLQRLGGAGHPGGQIGGEIEGEVGVALEDIEVGRSLRRRRLLLVELRGRLVGDLRLLRTAPLLLGAELQLLSLAEDRNLELGLERELLAELVARVGPGRGLGPLGGLDLVLDLAFGFGVVLVREPADLPEAGDRLRLAVGLHRLHVPPEVVEVPEARVGDRVAGARLPWLGGPQEVARRAAELEDVVDDGLVVALVGRGAGGCWAGVGGQGLYGAGGTRRSAPGNGPDHHPDHVLGGLGHVADAEQAAGLPGRRTDMAGVHRIPALRIGVDRERALPVGQLPAARSRRDRVSIGRVDRVLETEAGPLEGDVEAHRARLGEAAPGLLLLRMQLLPVPGRDRGRDRGRESPSYQQLVPIETSFRCAPVPLTTRTNRSSPAWAAEGSPAATETTRTARTASERRLPCFMFPVPVGESVPRSVDGNNVSRVTIAIQAPQDLFRPTDE